MADDSEAAKYGGQKVNYRRNISADPDAPEDEGDPILDLMSWMAGIDDGEKELDFEPRDYVAKQDVEGVPTWVEYQPNAQLLQQFQDVQLTEDDVFFAPDLELCSRIRL